MAGKGPAYHSSKDGYFTRKQQVASLDKSIQKDTVIKKTVILVEESRAHSTYFVVKLLNVVEVTDLTRICFCHNDYLYMRFKMDIVCAL